MRAAASIVQEKDENILAGLQKRELNFNFRYRKQPAYPDSLWCRTAAAAAACYVSCHVRKPLKEKKKRLSLADMYFVGLLAFTAKSSLSCVPCVLALL